MENVNFKKSLMGFNPEQVFEYIKSLSSDFDGQIAEKSAQIDALKAENNVLAEQQEKYQSVRDDALRRLSEIETRFEEAVAASESMSTKIAELEGTAPAVDVNSQVGRMLMEAQVNASAILENADMRALEMKEAAADAANMTIDDIDATTNMIQKLRDDMAEMVEKFSLSICSISNGLQIARSNIEHAKISQPDEKGNISSFSSVG